MIHYYTYSELRPFGYVTGHYFTLTHSEVYFLFYNYFLFFFFLLLLLHVHYIIIIPHVYI